MVRQAYEPVELSSDETTVYINVAGYTNLHTVQLDISIYDDEGFDKDITIYGSTTQIKDLATVLQYAVHMIEQAP